MSTMTVPLSIFDRSRMSLISVSRSLPDAWIVLANSTCRPGQVALAVLAELVRQDQQRVERRPQLVRHVREELGLVLRRQRELLGLLLQRLAGLLDLLVLPLHLDVLLGQQLGLVLQLGVGLLELFLLALQLAGERLGLLEQVLRTHVRLDRVQHDADRFGELVEERLVRRVEPVEAGQLEDGLHLALEHDRHHDDVQRLGLAEPGRDVDVVVRDVGEEDLLLLQRALPDEALAELELVVDVLPLFVGVAREQLQGRLVGLLVVSMM
jgi:hypothetical protein